MINSSDKGAGARAFVQVIRANGTVEDIGVLHNLIHATTADTNRLDFTSTSTQVKMHSDSARKVVSDGLWSQSGTTVSRVSGTTSLPVAGGALLVFADGRRCWQVSGSGTSVVVSTSREIPPQQLTWYNTNGSNSGGAVATISAGTITGVISNNVISYPLLARVALPPVQAVTTVYYLSVTTSSTGGNYGSWFELPTPITLQVGDTLALSDYEYLVYYSQHTPFVFAAGACPLKGLRGSGKYQKLLHAAQNENLLITRVFFLTTANKITLPNLALANVASTSLVSALTLTPVTSQINPSAATHMKAGCTASAITTSSLTGIKQIAWGSTTVLHGIVELDTAIDIPNNTRFSLSHFTDFEVGVPYEDQPYNSVSPVITALGNPLTGDYQTTDGTWTGRTAYFLYQWYVNSAPVAGQTASTFNNTTYGGLHHNDEIYCTVTTFNTASPWPVGQNNWSNTIVISEITDANTWFVSGFEGVPAAQTGASSNLVILDEGAYSREPAVGNDPDVSVQTASAKFGSTGLNLSGSNGRPAVLEDPAFGTGDFTIELWCRSTSDHASFYHSVFGSYQAGSNGSFCLWRKNSANPHFLFGVAGSVAGWADEASAGQPPIAVNTWAHIAISRNGDVLRMFVNGIMRAKVTGWAAESVGNNYPKIGGNQAGANDNWQGDIDELVVIKGVGLYRYDIGFTAPAGPFRRPNVAPSVAEAPVITGTDVYGNVLTATTGKWSGKQPSTISYQWRIGGSNISGATASTYTTLFSQVGSAVYCRVTATNSAGSAFSDTNAITVSTGVPVPVNTVAPALSYTTVEPGSAVTVNTGTWTNSPSGYTYQWKRGGTNISGETTNSHTFVAGDDDAVLTCLVTATNAGGSVGASSNSINTVKFTPTVATSAVVAQGTGGDIATETTNPVFNYADSFTQQWYRNGVLESGQTGDIYAGSLTDLDTFQMRYVATNGAKTLSHNSNTFTYLALPANSVAPVIGWPISPYYGYITLTNAGTWSGNSISSTTYQWYKNGSAVSGQTTAEYTGTLASLDDIFCRVTKTNATGSVYADSNTMVDYVPYASVSVYADDASDNNTWIVCQWNTVNNGTFPNEILFPQDGGGYYIGTVECALRLPGAGTYYVRLVNRNELGDGTPSSMITVTAI